MKRVDVAIAVVMRSQRILICQRKQEDVFGGYWEFPGGKCEPGEELLDCLARELMEEVAIVARVVRKLTPIEHDYPKMKLTLHPFLCEHESGEPRMIACQRLEWVVAERLEEYRFPPANGPLLREIIESQNSETRMTNQIRNQKSE